MRGYEYIPFPIFIFQSLLFLPMRGYECSLKTAQVRLTRMLFLPMRGYEILTSLFDMERITVISPHEGL